MFDYKEFPAEMIAGLGRVYHTPLGPYPSITKRVLMNEKAEFCTYLTSYCGNKLPPFYIGSSTINRIHAGYKGSVRSKKFFEIWKEELRFNSHLFNTKIVSCHFTKEEARSKEEKLQCQLKVLKNPLYINMTIANKKFGICPRSPEQNKIVGDKLRGRKAAPRSPEWYVKQSISHKGKIASDVTKAKMSATRKGKSGKKWSEELRLLQVKLQTGQKRLPRNPEHNLKISEGLKRAARNKNV